MRISRVTIPISRFSFNGQKIKYKVNFQTNYPIDDGTNSTEYLSETDALRPGELTYTYYTLVEGWYDDREGGNQITKITGPMTLYAHWTENLIQDHRLPGHAGRDVRHATGAE